MVRSSNCELYQPLSNKVLDLISPYAAQAELYGIDESIALMHCNVGELTRGGTRDPPHRAQAHRYPGAGINRWHENACEARLPRREEGP